MCQLVVLRDILCCVMLCCAVLCCIVLYCVVCGVVRGAEGAVSERQWPGWSCTREFASLEGCVSQRMLCVVCGAPGMAGLAPPPPPRARQS